MLETRRKVKVGERIYWPGETLTPEDAAEMRSRPAFSLLVEEGVLVGHSPPIVESHPEQAVDGAQTLEPEKEFKCHYPGCEYASHEKHRLDAHIRMAHEHKRKTKRKR